MHGITRPWYLWRRQRSRSPFAFAHTATLSLAPSLALPFRCLRTVGASPGIRSLGTGGLSRPVPLLRIVPVGLIEVPIGHWLLLSAWIVDVGVVHRLLPGKLANSAKGSIVLSQLFAMSTLPRGVHRHRSSDRAKEIHVPGMVRLQNS